MSSFPIVLLLSAILAVGIVQGELKSVALLFRHGERTPEGIYPKYGETALYKDLGPGQLTLVSLQAILIIISRGHYFTSPSNVIPDRQPSTVRQRSGSAKPLQDPPAQVRILSSEQHEVDGQFRESMHPELILVHGWIPPTARLGQDSSDQMAVLPLLFGQRRANLKV